MTGKKRVTFEDSEIEPRAPQLYMQTWPAGASATSAPMRGPVKPDTRSSAPCGLEDGNNDADDTLYRRVAHRTAPAESLVHEQDPGARITAFNLDEEAGDGVLDDEKGFIPATLARQTAASPPRLLSSSDEEDPRERDADEDERDDWALEEADRGSAPAYSGSDHEVIRTTKRRRLREDEDGGGKSAPLGQSSALGEDSAIAELCEVLQSGEAPQTAIRRLKKEKKVPVLERVTELCDVLMGIGVLDVYEVPKHMLMNRVRWELAWGSPGGSGDIHGPFPGTTMVKWSAGGFFSHPEKVGWVRVSKSNRPWQRASTMFQP